MTTIDTCLFCKTQLTEHQFLFCSDCEEKHNDEECFNKFLEKIKEIKLKENN